MAEANVSAQMPRYKCHKEVYALKIVDIIPRNRAAELIVEAPFAPVPVSQEWVAKHEPMLGGYYVVYKDGYSSFSPAKAFEEGYTLIGGDTLIG